MPHQPEGQPAPADGSLPAAALASLSQRPWSVYVHVPYCRVRCGYCDFNTYAPSEWGGADPRLWAQHAAAEVDLAVRVLGPGVPQASTVFFGGGTPTLLPAADLATVLDGIRERWGLAEDAEVTTEANPDTLDDGYAQALAEAGFTRVSLGMQSAVPHVLATLDRTHHPRNVARAVDAARAAGLSVSLDLIYGTPGESLDDWRQSLETALAQRPDHLSAYALVIEEGTRMAGQVRRGVLPATDPDDQAAKYELADELLGQAGYEWYEVSNWSTSSRTRARHNEGYWHDWNWWGIGPGAHSHVGGVRWWNVKHPSAWAGRLSAGQSPAAAREELDADQRYDEWLLLRVRHRDGLPIADLREPGRRAVAGLIAEGLVEGPDALRGVLRLTLRGRLLADLVVRRLLGL